MTHLQVPHTACKSKKFNIYSSNDDGTIHLAMLGVMTRLQVFQECCMILLMMLDMTLMVITVMMMMMTVLMILNMPAQALGVNSPNLASASCGARMPDRAFTVRSMSACSSADSRCCTLCKPDMVACIILACVYSLLCQRYACQQGMHHLEIIVYGTPLTRLCTMQDSVQPSIMSCLFHSLLGALLIEIYCGRRQWS